MNNASPSFSELINRRNELLAPCFAQDWPNVPTERAEGVYLYDNDGKRYLDFLSGFGACNLGHNHPVVLDAAREQMERMVHAPIGVSTPESALRLAWELGKIAPGEIDMFFFGNSGGEAIDGAVKLARYVTGRPGIIAFLGGFHGRTMGATALTTSKAIYRTGHRPLLPEIYFARFPYPFRSSKKTPEECIQESLEEIDYIFEYLISPKEVAAILVEPVQGEGGYVIPPFGFLPAIQEICNQHGILLILDEVQTGFGRTGEIFAADTFNIIPDILCLAKGIANGFPLGAIAASKELMIKWGGTSHGTTFGGNPISCAVALATIEVLQNEDILKNSRQHGEFLLNRLMRLKGKCAIVGDVRGIGLMVAVEFIQPGTSNKPNPEVVKRILQYALEAGLILYPCGHWSQTIRLIPPLIITNEQLEEGLTIFEQAVLRV
jgi:4-aminobutyrate aminotransferase